MIALAPERSKQKRLRQRRTKLQRRVTKRRLLGIRPPARYRRWLLLAFVLLLFVAGITAAATAAVVYAYNKLSAELPPPDRLVQRDVFKTTTIYDRNGDELYQLWDPREGKRTLVHLSELPPALISATLATEDANFYQNPGFDLRSIARAVWQNLNGQTIVSGASTITQQLVRIRIFEPSDRYDRSYLRKSREVLAAYQYSQSYTKDQILEMYLNEIYYGNLSYGIEAAAQTYFDKPAQELTLAEAALLAGLPQSPVDYDPLQHPERAKERQEVVLGLMAYHGFISAEEAAAAEREPLNYAEPRYDIRAPHFSLYVRDLVERRFGQYQLYYGGLKVYTTLDSRLQDAAERTVKEHVKTLAKYNANDAALVAIAPESGEVLALVGSADYYNKAISGQVNMAVAERQPGSTLKPFTYLLAFQKGLSPATVVDDRERSFPGGAGQPPYRPRNHDGKFRGPVTLRQALANSLNIPAVVMLEYVGVPQLIDTLHRAGITTLNDRSRYGLALTLGGGEVRLIDLTFAYATLANQGRQIGRPIPPAELKPGLRDYEPVLIRRIEDAEGNVLEDYQRPEGEQMFSPQLAYLITDILSDDVAREGTYGRHSTLELARPAAAKTGTTDDFRDSWTIGYTPDLVAGVWVGNANNAPMNSVFGGSGAGPIWHDFMEEALDGRPALAFDRPPDLIRGTVSKLTGLRPSPGETVVSDWFLKGTVPDGWSSPEITPSPTSLPTAISRPTAVIVKPEPAPPPAPTRPPAAIAVVVKGVVPLLVGLGETEARALVDAAGLSNTYTNYQGPGDVPDDVLRRVPVGYVLSQRPPAGTQLPPGSPVYLAVRQP